MSKKRSQNRIKPTIPVTLDPEDVAFLKAEAEDNDTSVSQIVRWFIKLHRGVSFSPSVRFDEKFIKSTAQEAK